MIRYLDHWATTALSALLNDLVAEHLELCATARSRSLSLRHPARPHVAKNVRDFCLAQHMQLLPWPAYSPDMSPIEHVWDLVGRRLARDPRSAASKDELLLRIQAIWNYLPQADNQNLLTPRHIVYSTYYRACWLHQITK
ncbi:hypothetical protein TNCV_1769051 [Trichonephila clavipes]|nr:hypothetical protein TNCV_1769051 [Trichonephila clavipes]